MASEKKPNLQGPSTGPPRILGGNVLVGTSWRKQFIEEKGEKKYCNAKQGLFCPSKAE